MPHLLLTLDFLCPLFFLFLGRKMGGKRGRRVVNESLAVLCLSLIFAPIACLFCSLAVQGILSALLFLVQFSLISLGEKAKGRTN